jgi:CubicO group peptidase (beta-lactamase class C family)
VARNGLLVYERYLEGDDEIWGRKKAGVVFGPDSLHDLRSITKSVVSLLYGIALAEGTVPVPETPLLDAFPEYGDLAEDPARRAITVHHALSMTMGTEWSEDLPYSDPKNSEIAMNRAPDSLRFVLDRPLAAEPGTAWTYNGGATEILAGLIARGNGDDLAGFARERLFAPLGIARFEWITDYYGRPHAASALRLRPRDTLKFGQIVLADGLWDGRRIVPEDWIGRSTSEQAEGGYGCRYGYQWWLCETGDGSAVINASGYGGQELLVLPELDLVMLVHAGLYGDETAYLRAYALLEKVVIPAIVAP